MKYNFKKTIYMAAIAAAALSGCKKTADFLQLDDTQGVDAKIWEEEAAVQYFLNDSYQMVMPEFIYQYTANNFAIHFVSDENFFSANDAWGKKVFGLNGFLIANDPRFIAVKYQATTPGDNKYFDVNKCNMAIQNLPNSQKITGDARRELLGQFYALRGMIYLGLTKYYGGVPLVLEPQDPNNLKLEGRVKAKVMFEQIIKDFDAAIENLDGITYNDANERGKLTKAAVAALKAKALLWWASPLFNPQNDPKHPYDPQRWQPAFKAAEEAYSICLAAGHKLMPNYATIFQTEGTGNTEALIVRSYSSAQLKRGHGVEARSRPLSEGGSNDANSFVYYPSWNMLNAYTMSNGLPITHNLSGYDEAMFWQNRDPRFNASIAYNGSTWKLSGKTTRKQWSYVNALNNGVNEGVKGLYVKRFSSPDLPQSSVASGDFGGSGMDWIEMRFAEVILDYAEAANATGNITLAKDLVKQIRQRAGIAQGSYNYGLDLATNTQEMQKLIMNERMVEFAFEGKRNDDLRRTRTMHLLQGPLESLTVETVSATLKTYLETPLAANPALTRRDSLDMNSKEVYYQYFKHSKRTVSNNGGFAMPEANYFFSFSNAFINSSQLLEQTIGWDGGTFDPL